MVPLILFKFDGVFGLKANIWKLYFVRMSQWFLLIMPFFFLFFQNAGLSFSEIFIIQGVYNGAAFLMEIPSGYIGDRLTRKTSLVLGTFLAGSGFLTYYFTGQFEFFILAAILMGVGTSFISGSDSALLYDTLMDLEREGDYLKFEGKASAFGNFAESIAAIVGGFIAIYFSIEANLLVQGCLLLFSCLLVISCKEPSQAQKHERISFWKALSFLFTEMTKNKRFGQIMLFSSFMGVNSLCMAWLVQPYMELHLGWSISEAIPLSEFFTVTWKEMTTNGMAWILLWSVLNSIVGVFAISSNKIYSKLGKLTVYLIALGLLVPYVTLNFHTPIILIVSFFIFYAARGLVTPLFRKWINESVESNVRATALSVRAFLFRILFAFVSFALLGPLMDLYSIETTFLVMGGIFTLSAIPYLLYVKKV